MRARNWAVYAKWVDEAVGGGSGWRRDSVHPTYEEAEREYNRLIAEDKVLGHKMNFAIEECWIKTLESLPQESNQETV